ncbi:MAG: C4-type zinc ribbon domain-containing protein [Anaerolineales bacterium]|nr:MAG: C4-type zinc ribbon domain-containing protein [Anaerolineales bacterium]
MSAALGLFRLQQVDSQIDQIHARQKAILETLQNDGAVRSASDNFSAAESRNKTAEREMKNAEAECQKQRIKIEQAESSLYGGKVHNPKELQDLQNDVASLKRHLATLENRELEAMLAFETTENEFQSAKAELEKAQANAADQHSGLTKESDALGKETDRLSAERKAVVSDLPQPSLQIYDQLRERKRGLAVAVMSDASCTACGTTLTPAQQQNARSASQLFNCPTCGRILYAN